MFAMQSVASNLQGGAVGELVVRGGRVESRWRAFGVGLAYAILLAALVLGAGLLSSRRLGRSPKVVVGTRDEVYYLGSATESDAQVLGKELKANGYFADTGSTVILDKTAAGRTISFVVRDWIWDKPDIVASFDEVAREAAPAVGGFPIKVLLVDEDHGVKRESIVGKFSTGNDHVYYSGAATDVQAQGLARSLSTAEFFVGKGADVFLSRESNETTLAFVVGDGIWDDAEMVAGFEKFVRDAAPVLGGLPIRLRLENTSLEVKRGEILK